MRFENESFEACASLKFEWCVREKEFTTEDTEEHRRKAKGVDLPLCSSVSSVVKCFSLPLKLAHYRNLLDTPFGLTWRPVAGFQPLIV